MPRHPSKGRRRAVEVIEQLDGVLEVVVLRRKHDGTNEKLVLDQSAVLGVMEQKLVAHGRRDGRRGGAR